MQSSISSSRVICAGLVRGSSRTLRPSIIQRLNGHGSIPKIIRANGFENRPILPLGAAFSTQSTGTSMTGGIRGWMEERSKRKQHEQYMEQMQRLSEMEELTLSSYKGELERGLNQWGAKISFLQTKEIKTAKEIVAVVQAMIDVKGGEANADDVFKMDRLERLKVATAASKTVEELSMLISQIQNMDLMQRTLRKRHLEGKPIPPDPTAMQTAIKKDAMAVMTKSQKEMMMKRQEGMARRSMRKRR